MLTYFNKMSISCVVGVCFSGSTFVVFSTVLHWVDIMQILHRLSMTLDRSLITVHL